MDYPYPTPEVLKILEQEYGLNNIQIKTLIKYTELLYKWSKSYNLIGPNEFARFWERHILDSLNIIEHLKKFKSNIKIVDLGSGSGLPGVIIAISGFSNVHLIEKSQKKCTFLKHIKNSLGISIHIHQGRVEDQSNLSLYKIIVSRGLAEVATLLKLLYEKNDFNSVCFFYKGENYKNEIENAKKWFDFTYQTHLISRFNNSVILEIHKSQ